MESAIDHGTALLAALGLPRLVTPDFVALDREAIGVSLQHAIATLDALDAPGEDLEDGADEEPSLGWREGSYHGSISDGSSLDLEFDTSDLEPGLGEPEQASAVGLDGRQHRYFGRHWIDRASSQTRWGQGPTRDLEEEHDGREAMDEDGDDLDRGEHDTADLEPSLGAPEVYFGHNLSFRVDQTAWAGGGLSDLELDDIHGPADLDGLHEQLGGTGLVPPLDYAVGGYVA